MSGVTFRLVHPSVGRALGSHYAKYTTRITLFYQGKLAIIGVHKGKGEGRDW